MKRVAMFVAVTGLLMWAIVPCMADENFRKNVVFHQDVTVKGGLNQDAEFDMQPDENRDPAKAWEVEVESADGDLTFNSKNGEQVKLDTNGNLTATGIVGWTPSAAQAGAKNGSAVTATFANPKPFAVTLTLANLSVPIINGNGGAGTNWTGGVKIYDFPEGLLDIEAVLVSDVIMATSMVVAVTEGGDWALGTAIEAGDTLATATAVDLCPATSCDTWATTNSGYLAAGTNFDGTATAIDAYFNVSVDSGDISATTTVIVSSASITITGKMCGDD